MMFIVRSLGPAPPKSVIVKVVRRTPAIVPQGAGKTDYFCVGGSENIAGLQAEGWKVVELRDGWYEDDAGGGVAISGHGKYWEVRDTPFTVKESGGPAGELPARGAAASDEPINVRGAVFGVPNTYPGERQE
jgi:hypothetical protein